MTAPLVTDKQPPQTESRRMTAEEIRTAAHRLIADARQFVDSELSPRRADATKYYNGEPLGNEEEGRSQVVLTEVRDTTRGMLPSLLRMALGSEKAVEFEPHGPEDVAGAEQATDYISGPVMQQDNPGFMIIEDWLKDGLVREQGVVKWWWERSQKVEAHIAYNVSMEQILALESDPSVELSRISETGTAPVQGMNGVELAPVYTVEFRKTYEDGCARFACLPPDEVLFTRGARSKAEAPLIAHQTEKTTSELLELGIPEATLKEHGGLAGKDETEETARQGTSTSLNRDAQDWPNKLHTYTEAWIYLDVDGDGIAELRKFCCLKGGYVVNGDGFGEPAEERPFAFFIPDREPHTLKGQGVFSWTKDLQMWSSSLARGVNDSLSMSIFPRVAYVEGAVELADIQSTKVGQPITITERQPPNQVLQEFAHEFHGAKALPVFDLLDKIKQGRVGPLPARLDPDALQSSTKSAVDATVTGAQEQVEMIARVFAESLRDLFKGLLRLVVQHQPRARMVRLRGQYVEVDPRTWNAEMDVRVNVALGAGLTEARIATLMQLAEKQEQVIMQLGPSNPLFTLGHYRNTLAAVLELKGYKDVSRFMNEVPVDWQPPPPDPSQQDPAQQIAQAEVLKAQAEVAKKQADMQKQEAEFLLKQAEAVREQAREDATLVLEREKILMEDDRERDKLDADIRLRAREIELKYNAEVDVAEIQADVDRERAKVDAAAKVEAAKQTKRVTLAREKDGPKS